MNTIVAVLNNEIVKAWISPVICAVAAGLIVHYLILFLSDPGKTGSGTGNKTGSRSDRPDRSGMRANGRRMTTAEIDDEALWRSGSAGRRSLRKKTIKARTVTLFSAVMVCLAVYALSDAGNSEDKLKDPVKPFLPASGRELVSQWTDAEGVKYTGMQKNGKIEGEGAAVYRNGEKYKGEFKSGLRDGSGTLYSSSGDIIYEGEWKDNVQEGRGTNYFGDNGRYVGEFKAGKREGDGIYYWNNGSRYEGKWENDIRNGIGVLIGADGTARGEVWLKDEFVTCLIWEAETWVDTSGTVYSGRREKDEIEGYGRVVYKNGDIYLGNLKGGKREGEGVCYYQNGDRYEGEWVNDEKNGFGIRCYQSDGDFYVGEYADGLRNGTGIYYDSSGFRYEGEWKDGEYFGNGIAWYPPDDGLNRWYFEGEWTENGQNGTMYYKDGTCRTGIFQNGELVDSTGNMLGISDQPEITKWTDSDGTQYIGRQENGVLEGMGISINASHEMYLGEFAGGKPNGSGTEYYSDGDYYVGTFTDGVREGTGVYYYSDGETVKDWYYGEWEKGKRSGACIFDCCGCNLRFYIGNYANSSYNGRGNMHYVDGVYDGEWENGIRAGTGVWSELDGSCYFGGYDDNQRSGYGVRYYVDGSCYEGEWENNMRNGIGTEYSADGNKIYGTWKDDEYQN